MLWVRVVTEHAKPIACPGAGESLSLLVAQSVGNGTAPSTTAHYADSMAKMPQLECRRYGTGLSRTSI